MKTQRILLVGYYGKGNFGDDVLLNVTHGLLRRALPDAKFSVIVGEEGGEYVRNLLGDVAILKPARQGHFDIIVHGGGGVFFDFNTYGKFYHLLEKIIHAISLPKYIASEKLLRAIIHKPRTSATRRFGFGIGVGRFTQGSQKLLRHSLPILSDFDALWVRDDESVRNLKRFSDAMKAKIICGSDLAFLTDYWLSEMPQKTISPRPRLGIILRDRSDNNMPMIAAMIAECAKEYEITGFVLEEQQDPKMIALLAPYTTHIWQPQSTSINGFMQHLACQDVLITSRAHGAICGACVGVPSVIVNIEPKLAQVNAILPNSTLLVPSNDTNDWKDGLQKAQKIKPKMIAKDVAENRRLSEAAWKEIQQWIN